MAMHNPPHPGESLREDVLPAITMSVAGWRVISDTRAASFPPC